MGIENNERSARRQNGDFMSVMLNWQRVERQRILTESSRESARPNSHELLSPCSI